MILFPKAAELTPSVERLLESGELIFPARSSSVKISLNIFNVAKQTLLRAVHATAWPQKEWMIKS